MSPPSLFQFQENGRNWKVEEVSPPLRLLEPEIGVGEVEGGEHTILEREVADIIIYLLHQQGSVTDRRFRRHSPREIPSDFGFPKWSGKRKRSVHASASVPTFNGGGDAGEPNFVSCVNTPLSSSPNSPCKENPDPASPVKSSKNHFVVKEAAAPAPAPARGLCCPNLMQAYFNTEISERGLLFWPGWSGSGGREFAVPDLNTSAEEPVAAAAVAAADLEMRRRQQEVYETAFRRLAAADARRKRKELQRLKNSLAADAPLCSRVR